MKRLSEKVIATVKEVDGEEFYCLAEILEQLGLKGGFNEKIFPLQFRQKLSEDLDLIH